jgi:sigma-E factor negative regulatory protein RseB
VLFRSDVRLGDNARVAGLECRNIAIEPRDAFRWGYTLCAEKDSGLPLKAVVVDGEHKPLMQYAFAEVKLGSAPHLAGKRALPDMPEPAQPIASEQVTARNLPPGFTRIAAVKRHLPNMNEEVEQWVFSDGLTHISLFLTPAKKPVETVKGHSPHGLVNLMRRQIGDIQVTVLGDAPPAAVETIALGLEAGK